jgi:hypothetical protein
VETLIGALGDRRGDVARAACDALAAGRLVVGRERLWGLFVKDRRPGVRVLVVRLLARGERVESVIALLWACVVGSGEGKVRDAAVRGLRAWGSGWPADVPVRRVFEVAAGLCAADRYLPGDLAGDLWGYVTARTGWERPKTPGDKSRGLAGVVGRRCAEVVRAGGRVVLRRFELRPTWRARVREVLRFGW